jgi:NAD(P)H-dependent FMN reductase
MAKVLVVNGSSRPGGVADTFVPVIASEVSSREGVEAIVVDTKDLELPFFNEPATPSTEGYVPRNEKAAIWTKMIEEADAVLMLTPEYNGSLSAIQKNAIDWISKEWKNKPIALVGYGWGGAARAHANAKIVLGNVKANVLPTTTNLFFTKDLDLDGTIIDEASVSSQLQATVDELIAAAHLQTPHAEVVANA